MSLTKKWGIQDLPPSPPPAMPQQDYVPVCQKLVISKYSNMTTHFKGNFILNHTQVIKTNILAVLAFLANSRHKIEGFL